MALRTRFVLLSFLLTGVASAATFTVTTANDAGAGSLRAAVTAANATPGDDDIVFAPALANQTITLVTSDATATAAFGASALFASEVSAVLTINGIAAPGLQIAGNFAQRIFAVAGNTTLRLENLTLVNGRIDGRAGGAGDGGGGGAAGMGGAVYVNTNGILFMVGCTVSNCTARGGNGGAGTGVGGGGGGGGLATVGGPNMAATGGAGGNPNGGAAGAPGVGGGFGGGGGGGNQVADPTGSAGGVGGFAGGGGGSGGVTGGPGTGTARGGTGGFGAGGGGRGLTAILAGSSAGGTGFAGGAGGADGASLTNRGGGGGGAGLGGGVFNNAGTVNLVNSTFTSNFALGGNGGAGSATPLGDGSSGTGLGGGIFVLNGTTRIIGCTFGGGNTGAQGGASLYVRGDFAVGTGTLTFENSIAADQLGSPNEVMATNNISSNVVITGSGNVIESSVGVPALIATTADPALQALANNGGPTQTMALGTGSSALGIGIGATCAAAVPTGSGGFDQRGVARTTCDAGAFEAGTGSIVVLSGTPQSTLIGQAFATPLRVRVLNGLGVPQVGVAVTFSAPGVGASATFSATPVNTDAAGEAQTTATANGIAGSYTVFATVATGASGSFALTNLAITLEKVSGDVQSVSPGAQFPDQLVVRVLNASGAPLGGQNVTFTAPGAGASATFAPAVVTSDAQGLAMTTATANGTAGTYTVTASLAGGANVTFTLTNTNNRGGAGHFYRPTRTVIKGDDCSLSASDSGPGSGLLLLLLSVTLLGLRRRS